MAEILDYGIGENLDVVTVVGQTIGAGGVLTAGTSYSLIDVIVAVRPRSIRQFEDIRPAWKKQINEVETGVGWQCSLTVLRRALEGEDIMALYIGFVVCQLTFTFGKEQWVGYFKIGEVDPPVEGHGQQTITLDLRPFDPGSVAQIVRTVLP